MAALWRNDNRFLAFRREVTTHRIHTENQFFDFVVECGFERRVSVGDNGTISSPGYPNATYDNSEQCVWTLRKGFTLSSFTLRFTDMAIERHGECLYDYVRIRSGQ